MLAIVYLVMHMNKKAFIGIVIAVFILVVAIGLMSSSNEEIAVSADEYEYPYYVEANDNIFVKLANICDDCCYYLVDMVLGGIESLFNSITSS